MALNAAALCVISSIRLHPFLFPPSDAIHVSQKVFVEALAGSRFGFWKAARNIGWCRFIRELWLIFM